MVKSSTLQLSPEAAADDVAVKAAAAAATGMLPDRITAVRIHRRSIDARSRNGVRIVLQASVYADVAPVEDPVPQPQLQDVTNAPHVVVVGAGPAGLFAALRLIELGVKPVVLERGKEVRARRRDLAAITREGVVNEDSNYCFGEGGAGTYSDGKLYTRSTKRGSVERILNTFIHFGADPRIGVDTHPHIGTNKLPAIITALREAIERCGGEVRFGTKLTDILLDGDRVTGVRTADGVVTKCGQVILATGHSARDVFRLLHAKGVLLEAKPFALGVRIEHPQGLIDRIQYHLPERGDHLPPASYSLVAQEAGRGVFSFCMCPGGIIAPAATAPGEVVVNGWSPSKRNNPYANSGTVVTVDQRDYAAYGFTGPLAGLDYQQMVEQRAFVAGGSTLAAPAQRMTDYAEGRISTSLPGCSYTPGIVPIALNTVLPEAVHLALHKAVQDFGKKMRGYYTPDAVLVATESRTSSPVRIPRDAVTLEHPRVKGLFPCAEGAGYAGGIVSAAIDGERCAAQAAVSCLKAG